MLTQEAVLFLKSLAVGGLLGFYYDLFYAVRLLFPGKWNVHIPLDILYCILAGAVTFRYILDENRGEIRFFILLGLVLGWVLYHFTLSRIFVCVFRFLLDGLKKLFSFLLRPIRKLLNAINKRARERSMRRAETRKAKREEHLQKKLDRRKKEKKRRSQKH